MQAIDQKIVKSLNVRQGVASSGVQAKAAMVGACSVGGGGAWSMGVCGGWYAGDGGSNRSLGQVVRGGESGGSCPVVETACCGPWAAVAGGAQVCLDDGSSSRSGGGAAPTEVEFLLLLPRPDGLDNNTGPDPPCYIVADGTGRGTEARRGTEPPPRLKALAVGDGLTRPLPLPCPTLIRGV